MTREQIDKILEGHKIWLESDGEEGQRANFSGKDISKTYLVGTNLSGADFTGANLFKVNFFSAHLRGANFSGANLSGAIVYGADFTGANIEGADFTNTRIEETIGLEGTIRIPNMTDKNKEKIEEHLNNKNPIDKLKDILKSRQEKYGDSEKCLSLISQYWSDLTGKKISQKDVCVMMAMMKLARLKSTKENGYDPDTFLDLAGYALLALEKE